MPLVGMLLFGGMFLFGFWFSTRLVLLLCCVCVFVMVSRGVWCFVWCVLGFCCFVCFFVGSFLHISSDKKEPLLLDLL